MGYVRRYTRRRVRRAVTPYPGDAVTWLVLGAMRKRSRRRRR